MTPARLWARFWRPAAALVALGYLVAIAALGGFHSAPVFTVPEDPFVTPLPAGFLWGAATAAHQIEGGNTLNDWAAFEANPSHIAENDRSGDAADHWNRVAEDTALLKGLGANSYRFSIEWSRVEPIGGQWDEQAWAHYESEIAGLRAAGIEPMVTLLHFTLPGWLAVKGGLTAPDFPERFKVFATEAARRFSKSVRFWCTVNEPNVQMYNGYVAGIWPPAKKNTTEAARAFEALLRGHALAAAAVRSYRPDARIGAAVNLIAFEPARRYWLPDLIAAREADRGFNWAFYDSIASGIATLHISGFPPLDTPIPGLQGSADYVGVNYYRRNLVRFSPNAPGLVELLQGPGPKSDAGVEIYPEGLLTLLRTVWDRYRRPIIVTENGIADAQDRLRASYIRSHAHAVAVALKEGIPVQGYLHWSLMDNFEWAEGFSQRFGLFRVDYGSQGRTEGDGAREFRRLAARVPPRPVDPPRPDPGSEAPMDHSKHPMP